MSARRRSLSPLLRLAVAATLAAALLPAGIATAAPGSDNFGEAPPLLFSASGSGNNQSFTTQAGVDAPAAANCPQRFHTAWWRFSGTGQRIDLTTVGSTFDNILAVYTPNATTGVPATRLGCNAGGTTSTVGFDSTRGVSYFVQVGSTAMDQTGTIALAASSQTRPSNDDFSGARVLQTGTPTAVGTFGASQELGELLTCGSAAYAATIWFRWTVPAIGDAVFSASLPGGDPIVTIYRASDRAVLGCEAASVRPVALRVAPGDYVMQVGTRGADALGLPEGFVTATAAFTLDPDVDNDGVLASSDCNDQNPAVRPGVVDVPDDRIDQNCDGSDAVNLDRDRDGVDRPSDCDDTNPAIRPGARDKPGNKVDEDCSGRPAPFPRLESTVRTTIRSNPFGFTRLTIRRAVAGSRIRLICEGRGCPFKRKVIPVRKSRALLSVLAHVKRARLTRGAVLEIRITKTEHVGFMRRVTVRGGAKEARVQDFCLPTGSKSRPKRC